MLNQLVVVGRLVNNPIENGEEVSITLAVQRPFKNQEGEYEVDFIPFTLRMGIAEQTKEYCKKGDLVGIKGRISRNNDRLELIAEKVTFLANKKGE